MIPPPAIYALPEARVQPTLAFLEAHAGMELLANNTEVRRGQSPQQGSRRGVAVLPVYGFIGHRAGSVADAIGTSTERFLSRLDWLLADTSIGTIVLDVNSPGGTVYGVPEAAGKLFEARGSKKIIAVSNALMASAAYWLGSAAQEVVVTPSGEAGSIGVFTTHVDFSRALEKEGVKITLISAGKRKAEGNPFEELSEEARAAIQASVADYYGLFVRAVAKHRGVSVERVRQGFGEGRVLTAQKAVSAGLADRVATMDQVLADLGVRNR